jgi:hypothetical protein
VLCRKARGPERRPVSVEQGYWQALRGYFGSGPMMSIQPGRNSWIYEEYFPVEGCTLGWDRVLAR